MKLFLYILNDACYCLLSRHIYFMKTVCLFEKTTSQWKESGYPVIRNFASHMGMALIVMPSRPALNKEALPIVNSQQSSIAPEIS